MGWFDDPLNFTYVFCSLFHLIRWCCRATAFCVF
jgi:hypothetical protein